MQASCKELRRRAWERLANGNYWRSVLVTFIVSVANGVAGIFTFGPMNYGSAKFFLYAQRGKKVDIDMIGDGFTSYGKTFLTGLLLVVFIFLWSLVVYIPLIIFSVSASIVRSGVEQTNLPFQLMLVFGFLSAITVWIPLIKSFSYSMTFYVMVDFNLSGTEAISKSVELMKGYKAKLFRLGLSFFGWYLLSSLTFGIGAIFLAPYVQATVAEFYAELLDCHGIVPPQSDEQNTDSLNF